jgi:hypothetical protein
MKDGQEASIWLDEFDELYDYHIPIWTQKKVNDLNTQIVNAIEQNKNVPPITFASETLLNHLNSELEYEITRMERRIKNERSGAAQYFRSTYPKFICWMFLCRATIKKTGVSISEVASSSGLTPNGVRSIFEDAVDAEYAYRFRHCGVYHYAASNSAMHAYIDRLKQEAPLFSEDRLRNLNAFQSYLNYLKLKE